MSNKAKQSADSREPRRPALLVLVWALTGVVLLGGQQSLGAQARFQRALDAPVKQFTLTHRPVLEGLLNLAYRYQLPLGVGCVDAALIRQAVSVRLKDSTVRTAIEALVEQLPDYRVDFSRGLVDVYCLRARRDASSVLNMTVDKFEVAHVDAAEASARLQGEVFAKLHPGWGFGGDLAHGETSPSQPRVTLRLRGRKVFEILNAIVAADGASMWLVMVPSKRLTSFSWNEWAVYNLNPAGREPIIDSLKRALP